MHLKNRAINDTMKKEKEKNKDPLDEIFVEYHKSVVKDQFGQWEFRKIDVKFIDWLNSWADFDKQEKALDNKFVTADGKPNHITEYGRGYKDAVGDIARKLRMEWKKFDKRTKSGFAKEL